MRVIQERLRIFNVNYEQIGAAYRDEVHLRGYWHEVFHCWVVEKIEHQWHIYLQLRSYRKKDYPGQYDITAAGHLMEDETVADGVRELIEELGIHVSYPQLQFLGVIPYVIDNEKIKDYEFANVFLYEHKGGLERFKIQRDELVGMYRAKLDDFVRLAQKEAETIEVQGYRYESNLKMEQNVRISLNEMSALPDNYLSKLIPKLQIYLNNISSTYTGL